MAAALEDTKDVSWLGNFPAKKRLKLRKNAFGACLLRGRWRECPDGLRQTAAIVAFAEARILCGVAAVVVERRSPEHAGVSHHACGNSAGFRGVASCGAAGFRRDPKIAGVYKFDVLRGFREPCGVNACG